jgi:hypothetical protein
VVNQPVNRALSCSLNIYYQNVRGLRSKTATFLRNLYLSSYDVIILIETWLVDSVSDSELFDDRFVVWRRDRDYERTQQGRGGGVLVAVRSDLPATLVSQYCSSAEDLWLSLPMKHSNNSVNFNLNLCVIYLCKQNQGFSFTEQLQNFLCKLEAIITQNPEDIYLTVGDFNMSNIPWIYDSHDHSYSTGGVSGYDEQILIDDLHTHNLKQYNGILNNYGRILDLVLSNTGVSVSECHDPLVPPDPHHKPLLIDVTLNNIICLPRAIRTKKLFNRCDYNKINADITSIDWSTIFYNRT